MYLHFFGQPSSLNQSDGTPYYSYNNEPRGTAPTQGSHARRDKPKGKRSIFEVTLNSRAGTQLQPGDPDDNVMWSECRRASSTKSATASEISLEPQIQKKTEFYVQEDGHSETSNPDQIEAYGNNPKSRRYF